MMRFILCCNILFMLLFTTCIPPRALFLGAPDKKDSERFSKNDIPNGTSNFQFKESKKDWTNQLMVNDHSSDLPVFKSIETVLKEHKSRAFLLIKNDSILLEYYRDNIGVGSTHASYSVAKSFTSILIGFAIQDGFIEDEQTLVKAFIPEIAKHPQANKLTIEHLLNQTSGIKYTLSSDAIVYYGNDILKAVKNIEFEMEPGQKQSYLNINAQLLGLILKRTTKMKPSEYLSQKIWQPLGMESAAFWSTDKQQLEKTYCCLNATARDYARFGRLMNQYGEWEGQQLLNEDWIKQSLERNATKGSSYNYNYSWHIGLKEYGDYFADGMYQQYIYFVPDKDIVIVLFNDKEKKLKSKMVRWQYLFRQLIDQL